VRKYRPTGIWYYKKDERQTTLEVKHRNEASIWMTMTSGQWTEQIVTDFLQDNIMPLFGPLTPLTYEWYLFNDMGLISVLYDTEGDGGTEASEEKYRPELVEVATMFKAKFHATFLDTSIPRHREWVASEFGITDFPAIVVQLVAGSEKFSVYRGPLEAAEIAQFITDSKAGCHNYKNPLLTFNGHRRAPQGMCRLPASVPGA